MSVSPVSSPELLTSWKEIASHLGKGVRTVQRWEEQFGLPVRRPNQRSKGIVHATRQDLDRWLQMHWSERSREDGRTNAQPMDKMDVAEVHARIRQSEELRSRNRMLLASVKLSLETFCQECEILARNLTDNSPPPPA